MQYGTKRDYKKIDINLKNVGYVCSTTWASSCKEAKAKYSALYPNVKESDIKANFSDN